MELTNLSLNQRLSIYIQTRYTPNPRLSQRHEMTILISMLAFMYPSVKEELGLERRCIQG